jgi:mRNA interferase RelE/StbE
MFNVEFSLEAANKLVNLDKRISQRILNRIKWLSQHYNDINHKALSGHLKGAFKLRVGDYRVIYEMKFEPGIIIVRLIGHRSEIYK